MMMEFVLHRNSHPARHFAFYAVLEAKGFPALGAVFGQLALYTWQLLVLLYESACALVTFSPQL